MKKWICCLLALALCLPLAAVAEAEEEMTIVLFRSGQGMPAPEDDVILPGIEEALGVNVEWNVISAEYDTQLNVRLAGGNAPDIFEVPYLMAPTYAQQGLLLDIEPYLDQMPHFKEAYTEEYLEKCYVAGGMYMIAARPYIPYADYSIRRDWLDAVGMDVPTTLEELYDVLYAFTYNDPDGNGKDDTYGITGQGLSAFNIVFNAYGTTAPGSFLIEDNQVVYSSVDPRAKEAIAFIQTLIDAGVVDPEIITNQSMEHRDKALSGYAGILACSFWDLFKEAYMDQALEICPTAQWELMMGVEGPGGKYDDVYDSSNASAYFAINADLAGQTERLNKVLELVDFLCDEETGQRLAAFGLEGTHYELDEEGNIVALPALNDVTYSFNYLICGRDDLPYLKAKFPYLDAQIDQCNAMTVLPIYNARVTVPEGVTASDIERYATEEVTRFIYGERSLDEWDAYVDTLYSVYNLQAYLNGATADLTEAGYIQ